MANGYGVYTCIDGSRFEGNWVNNNQEGQGNEYLSNGATYTGNYKDGKKHLYGIY